MTYFVLVRFEKNGEWSEITREFADHDDAVSYAEDEYKREADNISVCLYRLERCWF